MNFINDPLKAVKSGVSGAKTKIQNYSVQQKYKNSFKSSGKIGEDDGQANNGEDMQVISNGGNQNQEDVDQMHMNSNSKYSIEGSEEDHIKVLGLR